MPQGSDAEDYSTLSVQPSLELSWTLFGGFRVWRTKAKLDAAQEQAEGSQTVLIENTVRSIISVYYQAVLESEKVTIAQQLMDASMDRVPPRAACGGSGCGPQSRIVAGEECLAAGPGLLSEPEKQL